MPVGERRYCAKIERMSTDGDVDTSPDRWRVVLWRYWVSKDAATDSEQEEGRGVSHLVSYEGRGDWLMESRRPRPQDRMTIGGKQYTVTECVDPDGRRKSLRLRYVELV